MADDKKGKLKEKLAENDRRLLAQLDKYGAEAPLTRLSIAKSSKP